MTSVKTSTKAFEKWLRKKLADRGGFDKDALKRKHKAMKKKRRAHQFLRGTFYRWAERWKDDKAIKISAVGDIHVENFGTWRDAEGRLVWGVNDFDEACTLPWTSDLVRLGVSAKLALDEEDGFKMPVKKACRALWKGYEQAITGKAAPVMLAEKNDDLGDYARKVVLAKSPDKYWGDELADLRRIRRPVRKVPEDARDMLKDELPVGAKKLKFFRPKRSKPPGMGSRGKRRFYALATWQGGRILRETKPLVPSALVWAKGGDPGPGLKAMLKSPSRCPDPFHKTQGKWVVRRLAVDSTKIELKDLVPSDKNDKEINGILEKTRPALFKKMGVELGNLHVGSGKSKKLRSQLEDRGTGWFYRTVKKWAKKVKKDYHEYRR